MNELSLFSGAGGGLLATHHLLGWNTIGYVEWEPYCQAVIAARIADGLLAKAPIFGDIREFVKSGAAREYRGFADVVTAGFPCQPFSAAGKGRGKDDERNMWPATRDVIRDVRPSRILLENVPGLLSTGYACIVAADLAALGYVGANGVLSASDEGADHIRERLWFAANADCHGLQKRMYESGPGRETNGIKRQRSSVDGISAPPDAPDADGGERSLGGEARRTRREWEPIPRDRDWPITSEPVLGRGEDGVADRLDRLKATGNGQVPAVVVRAWSELSKRLT